MYPKIYTALVLLISFLDTSSASHFDIWKNGRLTRQITTVPVKRGINSNPNVPLSPNTNAGPFPSLISNPQQAETLHPFHDQEIVYGGISSDGTPILRFESRKQSQSPYLIRYYTVILPRRSVSIPIQPQFFYPMANRLLYRFLQHPMYYIGGLSPTYRPRPVGFFNPPTVAYRAG